MIQTILDALKEEKIAVYLLKEETVDAVELFYIKKEQDMRRNKAVCNYILTVYQDFEKDGIQKRGACTTRIFTGMTKDEIREKIKETAYSASFAANAYYELPKGGKEEMAVLPCRLHTITLDAAADEMAAALFCKDDRQDAFLNSAELFVEKRQIHILNSEGIDVCYQAYIVKGEFVVQCRKPKDVEYYESFAYDDVDAAALEMLVAEALDIVKARAEAAAAPCTGEYDVILSGRNVRTFLGFYTSRTNASCIYPGYTNYKIGDSVQGTEIAGEKINLSLKASYPYSAEGIKMEELSIIEDGILKVIQGDARYAYYLKIKPTGLYDKMIAKNGTISFETMKQGKCLHVVSFSDFDVDAFSGSFGGEIRLAYLYENGKITYVTGGSISGSLFEAQKNIVFSTEIYKNMQYEGPMAVKVLKVAVAGT